MARRRKIPGSHPPEWLTEDERASFRVWCADRHPAYNLGPLLRDLWDAYRRYWLEIEPADCPSSHYRGFQTWVSRQVEMDHARDYDRPGDYRSRQKPAAKRREDPQQLGLRLVVSKN